MNVKRANEILEEFNTNLNGGLAVSSLWIRGEKPIANYGGGSEKGAVLFDQISTNIQKALAVADFPEMEPYYLWKVEGNMIIGAVLVENIQTGIVIDLSKTSLGVLLNIAIPSLVTALKESTK